MNDEVGVRQRAVLSAALFAGTTEEIQTRVSGDVPGEFLGHTFAQLIRRGLLVCEGHRVILTSEGRRLALQEWRV